MSSLEKRVRNMEKKLTKLVSKLKFPVKLVYEVMPEKSEVSLEDFLEYFTDDYPRSENFPIESAYEDVETCIKEGKIYHTYSDFEMEKEDYMSELAGAGCFNFSPREGGDCYVPDCPYSTQKYFCSEHKDVKTPIKELIKISAEKYYKKIKTNYLYIKKNGVKNFYYDEMDGEICCGENDVKYVMKLIS